MERFAHLEIQVRTPSGPSGTCCLLPALIRGTQAKFDHVIRRVYFLVKSSTNAKFVSSLL